MDAVHETFGFIEEKLKWVRILIIFSGFFFSKWLSVLISYEECYENVKEAWRNLAE